MTVIHYRPGTESVDIGLFDTCTHLETLSRQYELSSQPPSLRDRIYALFAQVLAYFTGSTPREPDLAALYGRLVHRAYEDSLDLYDLEVLEKIDALVPNHVSQFRGAEREYRLFQEQLRTARETTPEQFFFLAQKKEKAGDIEGALALALKAAKSDWTKREYSHYSHTLGEKIRDSL